jgi:ribosomal protein S18 acetylase RimI-like enzyme
MLRIKVCAEDDRTELRALFSRAGQGAPTETLWGHEESEAAIYLYPYLAHGTVLAAVVDGTFAGYLAGTADTATFPSEQDRMTRAIREHRLTMRRAPLAFFARSMVDVAVAAIRRLPSAGERHDPRWPAHLHINVAPEARGTGAADALVKEWLGMLGDTGCHLQTLRENTRAVRFFERMGFTPDGPEPLVPGMRYQGGRVHQKTMVRP